MHTTMMPPARERERRVEEAGGKWTRWTVMRHFPPFLLVIEGEGMKGRRPPLCGPRRPPRVSHTRNPMGKAEAGEGSVRAWPVGRRRRRHGRPLGSPPKKRGTGARIAPPTPSFLLCRIVVIRPTTDRCGWPRMCPLMLTVHLGIAIGRCGR